MEQLKLLPTPELYALWAFSKQMLAFWENSTEPDIEKYYKTISDQLMDIINGRIENLFPELTYLID